MAKLPDEEPDEEKGAPAWVVTFGDMMSILVVFFVMMLSFSVVDQVKFKGFVGSIKEAFGVQKIEFVFNQPAGASVITTGQAEALREQLVSLVSSAFSSAKVKKDGEGVLLTIPGSLLFDSGQAEIKPQMFPLLNKIATLLNERHSVMLQVEGHTDDMPIRTARFKDNWDLSTARASSVVRYFIQTASTPPDRLAAAGYADSRPLSPNDSTENREHNRRVEFLFVLEQEVSPVRLDSTDPAAVPSLSVLTN